MAKMRPYITREDLISAREDLLTLGVKTRTVRSIGERIGLRKLNELFKDDIEFLSSIPNVTSRDLSEFRQAFIEEVLRTSNNLPSINQPSFNREYNNLLDKVIDRVDVSSKLGVVKTRKSLIARADRNNIHFLSAEENYKNIFYLFEEAKKVFMGELDPVTKEWHNRRGGLTKYNEWLYEFILGDKRTLNWNKLGQFMSSRDLAEFTSIIRSSKRDGDKSSLMDNKRFARIVKSVSERLVADAESKAPPSTASIIHGAKKWR